MKITNKFNLPDPIVQAIQNDPYSSGKADISTTRLISPPQIVALQKRYAEELEEDVSERIWSLLGQSIHVILERAAGGKIVEKRYFAPVEGWTVSGAVDLLDEHTLVDYKVTSTWTYLYKSRNEEWAQQGNINRWLYHQNGGKITKLKNVLILRDWVKSKADMNPKYPQVQIVTVDLPLWSLEKAEEFVKERVRLHRLAQVSPDQELPECSDDDIWIKKNGERTRCKSYCNVSRFCQQLKRATGETYLETMDSEAM